MPTPVHTKPERPERTPDLLARPVSRSQQSLYGSLENSLQSALADGISIQERLNYIHLTISSILGYREPATDEDVDEWIADVRSRLRREPMLLAIFDQVPPSKPVSAAVALGMTQHPRYSEMQFKLKQLEKIIRRLEDNE